MGKIVFVALAVWAAMTEILMGGRFQIEGFKKSTTETQVARDGTATCEAVRG